MQPFLQRRRRTKKQVKIRILLNSRSLGIPQSARDVFALLAENNWIDKSLAESLKRMIGFRNIAVHEYQNLQLPITVKIINEPLDDFLQYSYAILTKNSSLD